MEDPCGLLIASASKSDTWHQQYSMAGHHQFRHQYSASWAPWYYISSKAWSEKCTREHEHCLKWKLLGSGIARPLKPCEPGIARPMWTRVRHSPTIYMQESSQALPDHLSQMWIWGRQNTRQNHLKETILCWKDIKFRDWADKPQRDIERLLVTCTIWG